MEPRIPCPGKKTIVLATACALLGPIPALLAEETQPPAKTDAPAASVALGDWWHGGHLTGNWFGIRDSLEGRGIRLRGKWRGAFYGVVDSEGGSRGFFDEEVSFAGELHLGKFLQTEALEGVTAFAGVRWRDPRGNSNPNDAVQASGMFNPSHFQSGTQWRLTNFGVEIRSAGLFSVRDLLVLRGGWIRPQKEFIDQPLSKLFLNNAIQSSKGLGGNIPFTSSLSTWGGTLRVQPVDWYHAKAGLFLAFPEASKTGNHGLAFQGYGPDPGRNGLMALMETGVTPKLGPSQLPGRYVFGAYYYGVGQESFNGTPTDGLYGFYWQADQMLTREAPTGPGEGETSGGKSFETPVRRAPTTRSEQGLSLFSIFSFAPAYNHLYPFYFHTGLVYRGLIPQRDQDQTLLALALGNYSLMNIKNLQQEGIVNQPNHTMVLEGGYRFQLNRWAFVQPFFQYLIQPNGTGAVQNATVLGILGGVNF